MSDPTNERLDEIAARAEALIEHAPSISYHVWSATMRDMLAAIRALTPDTPGDGETMPEFQVTEFRPLILAKRNGRGVREAAAEAGVSAATLSRVENGGLPDIETFAKLCRWLKVDPARLLGLPAQPEAKEG